MTASNAYGGAIYNKGTIGNITGSFVSNTANYGGAIYNSTGVFGNMNGNFIGNTANYGGAIYNSTGVLGNMNGNFIGNTANYGGAIYNSTGVLGNMNGSFVGNTAYYGGAIYNGAGTIGNIKGNFINNTAKSASYAYGGAIYNKGTIGNITGDFVNNNAITYGGAIYNSGSIGEKNGDGVLIGGIVNSNFINNFAKAGAVTAQGGAIWTNKDLNIIADNAMSTFAGNYKQLGKNAQDDNAIYASGANTTINFKLKNNGVIKMYDNIRGTKGYQVNIQGDSTNTTAFYMLNDMYNANLKIAGTTICAVDNNPHVYNVNNLTLSNNVNYIADVNLETKEMDRFIATSYGAESGNHSGDINVIGMNVLKDPNPNDKYTAVYFAQPGLKNNVVHALEVYTPIYKYNIAYDKDNQYDGKGDGGYFLFTKGDSFFVPGGDTVSTGNPSDAYNPAVLSSPVSAPSGGQSIVNETVRFAFQHADLFSQMPYVARMAYINQNRYAISELATVYSNDFENLNKGIWIKPFTSFERIRLHDGPEVDAITYGTLLGIDSKFKELKRGWYNVHSGYIGYNGSQLNYKGVDTSLNGGLLGLTETFYKDNFFTALTATVGATVGSTSTMYGNEDFTMLLSGIGSKTGYNFELKNGKYIIQPIMFMNYSFVNNFDYTNAAGVSIESSPFHTFQINPSIKATANLKNGWQPYASVGFVWNVLNSGKVRANNIVLPQMTVDPYVEYGVGVQRNWKERFTGYVQAMVRNGGRNGVALTFGFRWAIGKETADL